MRPGLLLILSLALVVQLPGEAFSQEVSPQPTEKSAGMGVGIGLASMLVPISITFATEGQGTGVLAIYSWIVGPLPGLMYAGDTRRGMKGVAIRAGTMVVVTAAAAAALGEAWDGDGDSGEGLGIIVAAAMAVTVFSWIADLRAIPEIIQKNSSVSPWRSPEGGLGARVQIRW